MAGKVAGWNRDVNASWWDLAFEGEIRESFCGEPRIFRQAPRLEPIWKEPDMQLERNISPRLKLHALDSSTIPVQTCTNYISPANLFSLKFQKVPPVPWLGVQVKWNVFDFLARYPHFRMFQAISPSTDGRRPRNNRSLDCWFIGTCTTWVRDCELNQMGNQRSISWGGGIFHGSTGKKNMSNHGGLETNGRAINVTTRKSETNTGHVANPGCKN